MMSQTVPIADRALLRELARLGNLLRQLADEVHRGALRGEPCEAQEVLGALQRIERRMHELAEAEYEQ